MKIKFATALLSLAFASSLIAQDYTAPRNLWGQPDFEGVWNFATNIPMERPAFLGDKRFFTEQELAALAEQSAQGIEALGNIGPGGYNDFWLEMGASGDNRTSLISYPENGRLPGRVEGVPVIAGGLGPDVRGERPVRFIVGGIGKDGPEDRGLSERCIVGFNAGPPFFPSLYNNNVQVFQGKDSAVIMTEMVHDARMVPIYDSAADLPSLDGDIELWSGDSRGYYDGDTLVVVTRNFSGLTQSFSAFGTAEDKVLTERFTRTSDFILEYEFTVEDPSTFQDKFTAMIPMEKVDGQLYEYACHEGNYGMQNILRGARMEEATSEDSR